MWHLECKWHLGGDEAKAKEVSLSSTKAVLPESASLPRGTPHSTTSECETQQAAPGAMDSVTGAAPIGVFEPAVSVPIPIPIPIECHGVKWKDNPDSTLLDCNGPIPERTWSLRDRSGTLYGPSCDPSGVHSPTMEPDVMNHPTHFSGNWLLSSLTKQQQEAVKFQAS